MTKVDVDNVRQHLRPPPLNISSWELNLMEKPTDDPEEHTNLIPHIPNYWTPADTNQGNYFTFPLYLLKETYFNEIFSLHGKYLGKYLHHVNATIFFTLQKTKKMAAGAQMVVLVSTTITFTATVFIMAANQPRVNAAKAMLENTASGPSVGLDVPMEDSV